MNEDALEVVEQFAGDAHKNALAMPPKVAAAVGAVMAAVPKLEKGEKNIHANYKFASIDAFLEAVRPLCAKNGLIIIQDEVDFDLREGMDKAGKPVRWLLIKFQFTLAHISGETWAHRPRRTIMVNAAMGAQAFGAAQSYALKHFERSLFQIATGEKGEDADSHPPGDLPKDGTEDWARVNPKKDWTGPLKTTEFKKAIGEFQADLDACDEYDQLIAFLTSKPAIDLMNQCERDAPTWWFGVKESNVIGMKHRIKTRKVDLAAGQEPGDA